VPGKPNTPMNCKLDWSMQRRVHNRGRHLIAIVGDKSIIGRQWAGAGVRLDAAGEVYDCLAYA